MAQIIDLARGDIPPQGEPWVMVDIRRMADSNRTGGPREAEGGFTFYADWQQSQDIKEAIRDASLLAAKKGIAIVYVRGRNA